MNFCAADTFLRVVHVCLSVFVCWWGALPECDCLARGEIEGQHFQCASSTERMRDRAVLPLCTPISFARVVCVCVCLVCSFS